VSKTDGEPTRIVVGGEEFLVGYGSRIRYLDFALQLVRAQQTMAPGSEIAASQSSHMLLFDPRREVRAQRCEVALNRPLNYRGYKFYQSEYQLLGLDRNSRPISRSVLRVTRDPGVRLKYAGSVMIAFGIVCMFCMKAYSLDSLRARYLDT
jgi:hypothetical protein